MAVPIVQPGWLIAPVDWDTFQREYWEKRPLIVQRDDPDYFSTLFTLADFDAVLSNLSVFSPRVRLVGKGSDSTPSRSSHGSVYERANGTEALFARFRAGETIIVNLLHEEWPSLRDLCRALAARFSGAFQVNAYLTPGHSRGLRPHYDTHDVFVLQIHGRKRWQLFNEAIRLPLGGQVHDGQFFGRNDSLQVVDLRPGDVIYVPRGWGHVADALDDMSLHLTVGAFPLNWALLVFKGVEDVLATDPRFRESLPIGFATEPRLRAGAADHLSGLLDALRAQLDPVALMDWAIAGAELSRQPRLEGHLLDLAMVDRIGPNTRLRRREHIVDTLHHPGSNIELTFHGKIMLFPSRFRDELRFVRESTQSFEVSAVPGEATIEEKNLIARKLVEEGYLTFAS